MVIRQPTSSHENENSRAYPSSTQPNEWIAYIHSSQQKVPAFNPLLSHETIYSSLESFEQPHNQDQLLVRSKYQTAVTALGQFALSERHLNSLFQLAINLVTRTLALGSCSIWTTLSDSSTMQQAASSTQMEQPLMPCTINVQSVHELKSLLDNDLVQLTHQQIMETRLESCDRLDDQPAQYGISVRIPGQVKPLGLLIAYAPENRLLSPDDNQFLQAIAHVLAAAIERNRSEQLLYTQTQVLEKVTSGASLQEIFENLCLLLEQQYPGSLCSILLLDKDTGRLSSGVAPSLPEDFAKGIDGLMIGEGAGSCGTAAYRGEAVFVTNIATDPLWEKFRDFALAHNILACWSMPFFGPNGDVLGTFALSHHLPCEPTPYHLQMLKTAAHLASIATERYLAAEKLQQQALYDDLTGLPNRISFMEQLTQKLQPSTFDGKQEDFAVLFLDVDHFKLVNDSLGHSVGDQLLIAIVRLLKRCIRATDCFARLSGDEFAILVDNIKNITQAQLIAERIRSILSFPVKLQEHEVFTSVSIGIAHSSGNYERPEELLRDADTAMYRAKALGRSRHAVFDQAMHTHALSRLRLEIDLRHAVEELIATGASQFKLYYQPIVSLSTGKIMGFESLIRWFHPERGMVSPLEFIPVAEETGLIVPIGKWVLYESCSQLQQWQQQLDLSHLMMSVNVSSRQFLQPDFISQIKHTLLSANIPTHCLKLEITESVLMETAISVTERLEQLCNLGVRLSLDDFGTGYSSLSYLHRFPVNTLKVDRSFVQGFGNGQDQIVQAIVTLAHSLTMDVIAEGIETLSQLTQLRDLNCEYGQGYLFSAPVNQDVAETMLRQPPKWTI